MEAREVPIIGVYSSTYHIAFLLPIDKKQPGILVVFPHSPEALARAATVDLLSENQLLHSDRLCT